MTEGKRGAAFLSLGPARGLSPLPGKSGFLESILGMLTEWSAEVGKKHHFPSLIIFWALFILQGTFCPLPFFSFVNHLLSVPV